MAGPLFLRDLRVYFNCSDGKLFGDGGHLMREDFKNIIVNMVPVSVGTGIFLCRFGIGRGVLGQMYWQKGGRTI